MYAQFFGLLQEPFSIAPDPRFLYMSDKHREALVLLNDGLARGASFVLLTGEIGAGKTTVWRRFLEDLPPQFDVASVVNPRLDVNALLARICDDLQVDVPAGPRTPDLIDLLHGHLLLAHAAGRRTLIVIDEAQALSADVLEQLRLLTNLDTSGNKLQVMLIGQPELRQILQRPQLEPLAQRVAARYHLPALSADETAAYVGHRLRVAGWPDSADGLPFDAAALAAIHRLCGGLPRRINVLCDCAMRAACRAGERQIGVQAVQRAALETFGPPAAGAVPPLPAVPTAAGAGPGMPSDAADDKASTAGRAPALVAVACAALLAGVLLAPRLLPPFAPQAPSGAAAPAAVPAVQAVAAAQPALPAMAMPLPSIDAAFSAATADEAPAWRALAPLWGVQLGADGEPCTLAAQQGLQCHRSRGGLAPIRQLARPGIVKLVDERGRVAHVLLGALSGDTATLTIAGVARSVPLAHLARMWRGDFYTFWRVPPGYVASDTGGSPDTGWLAAALAAVDGQGPAPVGDAALRARVFRFQLARGLAPDGVAGPLTTMLLHRATGADEPALPATATPTPTSTTPATTAAAAAATSGSRPF